LAEIDEVSRRTRRIDLGLALGVVGALSLYVLWAVVADEFDRVLTPVSLAGPSDLKLFRSGRSYMVVTAEKKYFLVQAGRPPAVFNEPSGSWFGNLTYRGGHWEGAFIDTAPRSRVAKGVIDATILENGVLRLIHLESPSIR